MNASQQPGPVVVAYSADVYGQAALDQGADLARQWQVPLVLVNATKGDALVDRRYAADAALDDLRAHLAADGVEVSVRHEVVADVAEAVLEAARELAARLIVVGVRPRSPVGKALLGSVGQRIVLDAECPVLSVKPPAATRG